MQAGCEVDHLRRDQASHERRHLGNLHAYTVPGSVGSAGTGIFSLRWVLYGRRTRRRARTLAVRFGLLLHRDGCLVVHLGPQRLDSAAGRRRYGMAHSHWPIHTGTPQRPHPGFVFVLTPRRGVVRLGMADRRDLCRLVPAKRTEGNRAAGGHNDRSVCHRGSALHVVARRQRLGGCLHHATRRGCVVHALSGAAASIHTAAASNLSVAGGSGSAEEYALVVGAHSAYSAVDQPARRLRHLSGVSWAAGGSLRRGSGAGTLEGPRGRERSSQLATDPALLHVVGWMLARIAREPLRDPAARSYLRLSACRLDQEHRAGVSGADFSLRRPAAI